MADRLGGKALAGRQKAEAWLSVALLCFSTLPATRSELYSVTTKQAS